jgi:hypothetical protein
MLGGHSTLNTVVLGEGIVCQSTEYAPTSATIAARNRLSRFFFKIPAPGRRRRSVAIPF